MGEPEGIHHCQTHAGSTVGTSPPRNRWNSCAPNASQSAFGEKTLLLVLRVLQKSDFTLPRIVALIIFSASRSGGVAHSCVWQHLLSENANFQARLEKVSTASKKFTSGPRFFWCVLRLAILHSQLQLRIGFLKCSNLKRVSAFKPTRGNTFFFAFLDFRPVKIPLPVQEVFKKSEFALPRCVALIIFFASCQ